MSLSVAFKGDAHPKKVDKTRIDTFEKEKDLRYYNFDIHHAAFTLPNYLKDALNCE
jgi:spermidine synthase